jgi:hypothetical protein
MSEIALVKPEQEKDQWSTAELAEQFGCDVRTVTNYANQLFPGKVKNGVKTIFNKEEVTVLLEALKTPVSSGPKVNLENELLGMTTSQTRAFKIEMLHRQIEAILQEEVAELQGKLAKANKTIVKAQKYIAINESVYNYCPGESRHDRTNYGIAFSEQEFSEVE